jgi:hypothetical protein
VRRIVLFALVVLAGCGGDAARENHPRPAPPVTVTAAILPDQVKVSPARVGAGRLIMVVSNQSGRPQRLTMETAGREFGNRARTQLIPERATGRLTIDAQTGAYDVFVEAEEIRAARMVIGPPRPSGQDRVLLP